MTDEHDEYDWLILLINDTTLDILVALGYILLDEWYGFYAMDKCGTFAMVGC